MIYYVVFGAIIYGITYANSDNRLLRIENLALETSEHVHRLLKENRKQDQEIDNLNKKVTTLEKENSALKQEIRRREFYVEQDNPRKRSKYSTSVWTKSLTSFLIVRYFFY